MILKTYQTFRRENSTQYLNAAKVWGLTLQLNTIKKPIENQLNMNRISN